jgi:hypothetical protein
MSKPKKPGQRFVFLLILLVPLAVVFMASALIIIAGMIPSLAALISDRDRQKLTALTVAALNLAACMPVLNKLWETGNNLNTAVTLLTDPLNWLIMFMGAGLGWVMAFGVPAVIANIITARDNARLSDIRTRQQQLIEEWGPEVSDSVKR